MTPPIPRAAAGEIKDGAYVFGFPALGGMFPDPTQLTTIERSRAGVARGVRLAMHPSATPPGPQDVGARLEFDAETSLALADKHLELEIDAKAFAALGVESVAISLQDGGPTQWQVVTLPPGRQRVTASFAPAPIVTGVGLRAVSAQSDGPRGFSLYSITVRPKVG
jgi:hypothetical protein